MLRIGLTGGIASGKSEVARYLHELGARVLDADRLAHETYAPGTEGHAALVAAFGDAITGPDRAIDRARLGARVFSDPEVMQRLRDIVWPLTRRLLEERMAEAERDGVDVFAVEVALLYEAGWQDLFDEVWLVRSPREAVLQRLAARGLDATEASRRLAAATDPDRAARLAGRIIENDGDLETLRARVAEAWTLVTGGGSGAQPPSPGSAR